MYKIITYKRLAVTTAIICFTLIFSSAANTFSPVFAAVKNKEKEVLIVMYHQISENKALWGDYVIPKAQLREDFLYLKNNGFTPIKLQTLLDFVNGKASLPKKPVVITFDDGQRSFITKVLPLLEEFNFPANVNIVGSLVDLYTQNGDTDDRYAYLNWNDIKALSKNNLVEIGHHSYNLHSLSSRRGMGKKKTESDSEYLSAMKKDIEKLNNKLLENINERPIILAYPYGIRNDMLFNLVKEKGFVITLTCRESINKISVGDNLYELGRFNRPYGKSSHTFFSGLLQ